MIDLDPVETINANGERVVVPHGRHLVLRVRLDAPRRVLLAGHIDAVYAAADAFQRCGWLDEHRLRGPGVLDMKSGLAIMLAGLQAYEAGAAKLGYDVLINSDEETGSASSAALIEHLAEAKIAALTYEPSLPGGDMARSRLGSGNYAVTIAGRSAHAGRNPEDGRNAIVTAPDLALRLAKGRHALLSVNPAKIDGGGPDNVVPAHAVLRFNLRPRGPEQMAEACALVAETTAAVRAEHEVTIHVHGSIGRPVKSVDAATERLFGLVAGAAANLGEALSWRDYDGVCDGNNIAACGVPVIDTMGANGDHIHSPNEYLDVRSLVPKAQLTALVLKRFEQHGALQ
ncbi:glutamate carboxypeptidase [Sphingomonas sp. UYAg733]